MLKVRVKGVAVKLNCYPIVLCFYFLLLDVANNVGTIQFGSFGIISNKTSDVIVYCLSCIKL
jgi:hypothetical protein